MVFTKDRNPHKWTLEEKMKLMELWKSETGWADRSKKMAEAFPQRKFKGFFSPSTCYNKFERMVHAPPPVPVPESSTGFKLSVMVDMWIEHYKKEIEKEQARQMELCMVDIRNSYSLIDRILRNDPPLSDDQLLAFLEEARARDKNDPNADVVVNAYMRRLIAQEEERKRLGAEAMDISPPPATIPPTRENDSLPRGAETAFRSPSPSCQSPIKISTPIRPIAQALREGITPVKTESPSKLQQQLILTPPKSTPEAKPVLDELPTSPSKTPTKLETVTKVEEQEEEEQEQMEPMEVEPATPTPLETPVSENLRGRSDSTRSRRRQEQADGGGKEEIADKTPVNRKRNRGKSMYQKPVFEIVVKEEVVERASSAEPRPPSATQRKPKPDRRRSTKKVEIKKEIDLAAAEETPVPEVVVERFATADCQTDITILSANLSVVPEKKERRSSTSRKTRGNRGETKEDETAGFCAAELQPDGQRRDVLVQCPRIELDRDDRILVNWFDSERPFVPLITLNAKSEEAGEETGRNKADTPMEEEPPEEKKTKGDKKEIQMVYDVDEWVAKSLLQSSSFEPEDDGSSISKRANLRKDEKVKEEAVAARTILMNIWNAVKGHRHSAIFLHPVMDRDAPNYSTMIKERMDLMTLKKEIEAGEVSTVDQMKHRLMRMFANAVMFNYTGHEINDYALEMARDTHEELTRFIGEDTKAGPAQTALHPRRKEQSSRPTRSYVAETSGRLKKQEELFSQTESATRKVFRRKRPLK